MEQMKMSVAEKLRHYRESCVLSQKQVADALNIDRSTYTKYETGGSEPNLKTLVRIAAIYNVSPEKLLPEADEDVKKYQQLRDPLPSESAIYQLAKDERGLIAQYRVLDREEKKQVREMMANLAKNS